MVSGDRRGGGWRGRGRGGRVEIASVNRLWYYLTGFHTPLVLVLLYFKLHAHTNTHTHTHTHTHEMLSVTNYATVPAKPVPQRRPPLSRKIHLSHQLLRENDAVHSLLSLGAQRPSSGDGQWHEHARIYYPRKEVLHNPTDAKFNGCVVNGGSYMKRVPVYTFNGLLIPSVVKRRDAHEWRHYILVSSSLPIGSFLVVWYKEEYLDTRYESPLCRDLGLMCADGTRVLGETVALVVKPVVGFGRVDTRAVFSMPMRGVMHIPKAMVHVPTAAAVVMAHVETQSARRTKQCL